MSEDLQIVSAIGALVMLSAFFSGSETALISSRRISLTRLANDGSGFAKLALKLLDDPGTLLGTILVGNNLVNVAAAALAASLLGPAETTLIMTIVLVTLAEIPPKTMAAMWPERMARFVTFPIAAFIYVLRPVVWIVNGFADLLLYPFTRKLGPGRRRFLSKDELRTALYMSQDAGELEPGETQMVQEVLDLQKVKLRDIMIPKQSAVTLRRDWPLTKVLEVVRRSRFTRYPIYESGKLLPTGLLHIKDLIISGPEDRWQHLIRPLPSRDENMDADDLLRDMQIARFHMVVVTNEAEEVQGFATMERILEEIVGEIADEHDLEADPIRILTGRMYRVRANMELADVAQILNVAVPTDDPQQTIDSFYRTSCQDMPTSSLRVGALLIRPGKSGYLIQLFEEPHSDDDEEPPTE